MIITDKFVLLNFPRTGSTFVRNAVKELYQRETGGFMDRALRRLGLTKGPLRELILPIDRTLSASSSNRKSQHGTYSQIPQDELGKPIVSVVRNPFDRIVSHYEHGFWRENPIYDPDVLRRRFPSYPELAFEQYLEMTTEFGLQDVLKGQTLQADVGPETLHFIRFFLRNPAEVIDSLTDDYIDSQRFRKDLPEIRFFHTEDLREELCDFLAEVGFDRNRTEFILSLPRKNVAESRSDRSWSQYLTDQQRDEIRHKERMLFMLFPEYDF